MREIPRILPSSYVLLSSGPLHYLAPLVTKISYSYDFWSSPAVTLTFDLSIPKSNHHIEVLKYICGQNLVKFPLLVLRCGVHKVFTTHRLTDSLTDGHTRKQKASGAESFRWQRNKYLNFNFGVTSMVGVTRCGLHRPHPQWRYWFGHSRW